MSKLVDLKRAKIAPDYLTIPLKKITDFDMKSHFPFCAVCGGKTTSPGSVVPGTRVRLDDVHKKE